MRQPQNERTSKERHPMKNEATPECKGLNRKTSDKKWGSPKMQGAQKKDIQWNMRQPQNTRGSNERPPMKNEATQKWKGLKRKSSDEKWGNPKTQGGKDLWWETRQSQNERGSKERPSIKNEVTPKVKGLKRKTPDEKWGNPKMQGAQSKDFQEIISSLKLALLNQRLKAKVTLFGFISNIKR
jgi:hypothetical protein